MKVKHDHCIATFVTRLNITMTQSYMTDDGATWVSEHRYHLQVCAMVRCLLVDLIDEMNNKKHIRKSKYIQIPSALSLNKSRGAVAKVLPR